MIFHSSRCHALLRPCPCFISRAGVPVQSRSQQSDRPWYHRVFLRGNPAESACSSTVRRHAVCTCLQSKYRVHTVSTCPSVILSRFFCIYNVYAKADDQVRTLNTRSYTSCVDVDAESGAGADAWICGAHTRSTLRRQPPRRTVVNPIQPCKPRTTGVRPQGEQPTRSVWF